MPAQKLSVIPAAMFLAACTPSAFGGAPSPGADFLDYRRRFDAAAGQELIERVERAELRRRILTSGVLWLGDHHRHSRLHALQLGILAELVRDGAELVLGLEAVGLQDQDAVRDYLAGSLDMRALRAALRRRWPGSWLDDPDLDPWFFRSLLSFARECHCPVFALEPTPRLALPRRDVIMARAVADARRQHPDRVVVVVVGQTHLRGAGDVVARSGVGGVVVGAAPTAALARPRPLAVNPGSFWRSDGDIYWFEEMFSEQ
ncbi:MAG: ChaN family lipoprotein [Planctomycetota bacterium]|nr:ChaN family lipoprotein [Planctomycetota bacterium]